MIWHCPTKDDVISIFNDANKPLDSESILDLNEVDVELQSDNLPRGFAILDAQCRICNYKELIIVPEIADLDNLECRNCGNMTMAEREVPDWEQE